jgi:hypothetical protein
MTRFVLLCLAFAVGAPITRGQDSEEVRRLKKEVELLQRELKVANAEIEQLKKENDQLKAAAKGVVAPKVAAGGPRVLSDMLTEGVTISGDFRFIGIDKKGDWALTIKKRSGKDFTGIYTAKQTSPPPPAGTQPIEVEAKGEIDGDRLTFSITNTAKSRATASGFHDKGTIDLDWAGQSGKAKMTAKAPK